MSTVTVEEQYQALRHGAGGRLVERDAVSVRGPEAGSYLQGQLSQDVLALEPGHSADSLVLSPQGKLDVLLRVTHTGEDSFLLDVESGWGEALLARLQRFKLRVEADLLSVPVTCLSVRGPHSASITNAVQASVVCPFYWNSVTGFDLLFTDGRAPSPEAGSWPDGLTWCDEGAWQALRVEAGIPAMGRELDDRTIAAEADLLDRCVSFTKGCYTGQELVARLDARGNKVARRLVGLVVGDAAEIDDTSTLAPVDIFDAPGGASVGTVSSWARSPVLGVVGLGYLHRRVDIDADVWLGVSDVAPWKAHARSLPLVA